MLGIEEVIKELKSLQSEHAHAALTKDSGSEFDYGKAVGGYLTIARTVERLEEMIAEDLRKEQEEEQKL